MKRQFDNISALESISLDSDFQTFTGLPNQAVLFIIGTYTAIKNLNYNGFTIANDEPEYDNYFNATKLPQAGADTLLAMANEVEVIGNAYTSNQYGQSTLKKTIDDFRAFAQKYYPNLKSTFYIQDTKRNELVNSLPQEYINVFLEPFYSDNLSQVEKVNMAGELRAIANRTDLSLIDKQNTAKDIIDIYVPTLPSGSSSTTSSMGSMGSASTDAQRTEGATTDLKGNITKYAIIGGVLVVGGIATWLILKRN